MLRGINISRFLSFGLLGFRNLVPRAFPEKPWERGGGGSGFVGFGGCGFRLREG